MQFDKMVFLKNSPIHQLHRLPIQHQSGWPLVAKLMFGDPDDGVLSALGAFELRQLEVLDHSDSWLLVEHQDGT